MLESTSAETFLPHQGSEFEVRDPGQDDPIVLVLAEVRSLAGRSGGAVNARSGVPSPTAKSD